MLIKERIFPIIIMGLILLFSLIHLGVSIGIIGGYRKYDVFFRPQIGLSGYNIAISVVGFVTGILGLFSILTDSPKIGKVACGISGALGIFALASLVAALIINSKSISYVSGRFSDNMNAYKDNANARDKVDLFQTNYQCCGVNTWLDWSTARLVAPASPSNMTTRMTTTLPTNGTTTIITTTSTTALGVGKRDVEHISNNLEREQSLASANSFRQKRQVIDTYGGFERLPIIFGVTFPSSCCTSDALTIDDASISYCVSNANNAVNHFYTTGCVRSLDTIAGNQAMGFGVINSFMVVLALVAIPAILAPPTTYV